MRPRRSLGQNFMVHPTAPARIVREAGVGSEHTVLEVGAGVGTLTVPLAERAGRVLAVETDPHLIPALREEVAAYPDVEIVEGDILELDPAELLGVTPDAGAVPLWGTRLDEYLVVANLPYYITSAVIRHLLEARVRPARMVFTVQYEVARRMVVASGKMSLLSVSLHFYGEPRLLFKLSRGAFYPMPQVNSAVVRLDVHAQPPIEVDDVACFFEIVRAGFAQRRKQLRNTLASVLHLDPQQVEAAFKQVRISHTRRAESLSLREWEQVYKALRPLVKAPGPFFADAS
ncbi:MAG: 16S rRNA (adenine(1518)-N(6)/adenine(1519)-N(6))-dimethyltransferase RsmA [Anaerolineae bacterium]